MVKAIQCAGACSSVQDMLFGFGVVNWNRHPTRTRGSPKAGEQKILRHYEREDLALEGHEAAGIGINRRRARAEESAVRCKYWRSAIEPITQPFIDAYELGAHHVVNHI